MKTLARNGPYSALAAACLFAVACGEASTRGPDEGAPEEPTFEGTEVPVPDLPGAEEFAQLKQELKAYESMDGAGLEARFPSATKSSLSYDPMDAEFLERIQASALGLSEGELAALAQNGFVISTRSGFATFLRGYAAVYSEHLPVYVTADAMLDAVHQSYDAMLLAFEQRFLIDDLDRMLQLMRGNLSQSAVAPEVKQDADFYLAVAQGLLTNRTPETGDTAAVSQMIQKATAADGIETVELLGAPRLLDFSQFTPRGHYTLEESLERYFRAMIWLGRVDLRLLETQPDGTQLFNRAQYDVTLLFHEILSDEVMSLWQGIEEVVSAFVGESDYMRVPEVVSLVQDLGGLPAAREADDASVVATIAAGGYGEQQIASHLMVNAGVVKTLPLNRSFAIFGQRYIVDSHVFSETVYDRIGDRLMPEPVDAAFAALGNNFALQIQPQIHEGGELPGALGRMRTLIDAHEDSFWDANFYNLWMRSLRALSPSEDKNVPQGMPEITGTMAWQRRMLNTQLASWAQLRHDTLLYAKQSYTGIDACEFPDAYVEPYPEFFAALGRYAERGAALVTLASRDEDFGSAVAAYFDQLAVSTSILGQMAKQQLDGEPYTEEQLAYINNAVRVEEQAAGCTTIEVPDGWYAALFFNPEKSIEFNPTIADVHTQPADWGGNIVGHVLHVGTGAPRLMVTTVDTCVGPRAYVGVSSAYHEVITDDFLRLTDEQWQQQLMSSQPPADVEWMQGILAE